MTYAELVQSRFGGVLSRGSHAPDSVACALEALAAWEGRPWTDDAVALNAPPFIQLNDAYRDDASRTAAMLATLPIVLAAWRDPGRRVAWVERVALETVRRVLPVALLAAGLTREAERCATVTTLADAEAAAGAAEAAAWAARAAARSAAEAAAWAAGAARSAAWAAARAAEAAVWAAEADEILDLACQVWREAAVTP